MDNSEIVSLLQLLISNVLLMNGFACIGSQVGYKSRSIPLSMFSRALNMIPMNLLISLAACGLDGQSIVLIWFSSDKYSILGTKHFSLLMKQALLLQINYNPVKSGFHRL